MSGEYPNIESGTRFDQTSAAAWRRMADDLSMLKRAVFGEAEISQSASGQRFNPAFKPTNLRWPDKTVVITRKPVEGDKMVWVREARYANLPPKPCTGDGAEAVCYYEWLGTEFEVYPAMGVKPVTYAGDENTDAVTIPPKLTTKFHRIHREYDAWILSAPAAGGGGTDIAMPFGAVSSSFIAVKRIRTSTGGGFTLVEPAETVRCWPNTDNVFWSRFYNATFDGTALPVLLVEVQGTWYAVPTWALNTFTPSTTLLAGDC